MPEQAEQLTQNPPLSRDSDVSRPKASNLSHSHKQVVRKRLVSYLPETVNGNIGGVISEIEAAGYTPETFDRADFTNTNPAPWLNSKRVD